MMKNKKVREEWRKVRTDAISEMFDNPYDVGIYPTSKFFKKIDDFFFKALQAERERVVEEINKALKKYHYDIRLGFSDKVSIDTLFKNLPQNLNRK